MLPNTLFLLQSFLGGVIQFASALSGNNKHSMATSRPLIDKKHVSLMEHEISFGIMQVRGTTTLTIYEGDIEAAAQIVRERFLRVARANPWVVGSLENVALRPDLLQPRVVRLSYPQPDTCGFKAAWERAFVKVDEVSVPFDQRSNIDIIISAVDQAHGVLESGSALIKDQSAPVSKITLLKANDSSRFGLVFSMCHVVADGFTYYRLLSMLSEGSEIVALSPTRRSEAMSTSSAVCGKDESSFEFSWHQLVNWTLKILFAPRESRFAFTVDKMKVQEAKAQAACENIGATNYVTTNDILTSTYGRAVSARALFMAINLRGRLLDNFEGSSYAGNYEGDIFFGPEEFEHPTGIRNKLARGPPFVRQGDQSEIPSICESFGCAVAHITSWVFPSFSGEVRLPGSRCMLHLPIPMFAQSPFELAIVFRPEPGKLAVLFSSRLNTNDFIRSSMPLGECLFPLSS